VVSSDKIFILYDPYLRRLPPRPLRPSEPFPALKEGIRPSSEPGSNQGDRPGALDVTPPTIVLGSQSPPKMGTAPNKGPRPFEIFPTSSPCSAEPVPLPHNFSMISSGKPGVSTFFTDQSECFLTFTLMFGIFSPGRAHELRPLFPSIKPSD